MSSFLSMKNSETNEIKNESEQDIRRSPFLPEGPVDSRYKELLKVESVPICIRHDKHCESTRKGSSSPANPL